MTTPTPPGHPEAPPPVDWQPDGIGQLPKRVSELWLKGKCADLVRAAEAENDKLRAALKEWVDYHEEFDAYPTSDTHPLYKTRKLLGLEKTE